jgi:hypothetical protein
MNRLCGRRTAIVGLLAVAGTGCSKYSEYPAPDGRSGVRGACWIQSADGRRRPWTAAVVSATIVNNSKYEWNKVADARVGPDGEFRMALVPGESYLISVDDSELLKHKATKPQFVRVTEGEFAEVIIEYPKILADPLSKGP